MKRTALLATGFSAIVALGLIGYGCTSGDSVGGTGGSTAGSQGGATGTSQGGATGTSQGGATGTSQGGATGTSQGGATGSQGGTTGSQGGATGSQGGATGGGQGGATGLVPVCASPQPADKVTACDSSPSCTKNCGVNAGAIQLPRAQKLCTCPGPAPAVWSCPSSLSACVYPTPTPTTWTCFHLPTPVPACPLDPAQTTNGGVVKTGVTTCTPATGGCGNVCGSATATAYQDGSNAAKMGYCACVGTVFQCASVNEWPPQ
jgi:hypothetical protein